ncbi:Chromosome partition protein Smc [compost metagenome]
METDTFQTAQLGHLDFQSQQQRVGGIALPDELPKRADLSHLPKDIIKSSTVENLISQNEDLMARLKVTLRRLSLLENENQRFSEEAHNARLSQSSVTDQILVWREKDTLWRHKVDQLEKDKAIQAEKLRALTEQVTSMSADLDRHQKYHERIKTQVKPYISQLKAYSKTQEVKNEELEGALANREAQLRDLRHQIIDVTKNSLYQVESQEKKMKEMVEFYETQIHTLQKDLQLLQGTQEELEMKSLKLHSSLERQDALENEVVALRRSKEEVRENLEKEILRLQERTNELTKHNQKLGIEHADLQIRVVDDNEAIKNLQKENRQYQDQLESLRYMWTAKNEENEKLKVAIQSLERLNLELSQKINEMRS